MIGAFRRRKPVVDIVDRNEPGHPPVDEGDGVVRISLPSLLRLRRGAHTLDLRPRRVLSQHSGGYLSPFKGRGMEFDEVRPYMQGDDVRTIDWRVTARSGKPHTKLFREERERSVLLWVDLRASMFFGTRGAFKSVRAAQAAVLLGWRGLDQGDRLGALIFDEEHHDELRPRRGQSPFLHLLRRLDRHPAWDRTERRHDEAASGRALNQSMLRLRRVASPGGLILLFSDFASFDSETFSHLAQLRRHSEIVFVAIHDPLESELPPAGRYRVSDGRTAIDLDSSDPGRRANYHRRFAEHLADVEGFCRKHGVIFLSLTTADDPLSALQQGLGARR